MLFVDFYYSLRAHRLPVSITEYLTFLQACDRGFIHDLESLYHVGRSLLVKDEKYYDAFDALFLETFRPGAGDETGEGARFAWQLEQFLDDLADAADLVGTPEDQQEFEKIRQARAQEEQAYSVDQTTPPTPDRGQGLQFGQGGMGNRGSGGQDAAGIRAGGASSNRSAMAVAGDRKFKNLRHDLVLDTRQFQVALKKLQELRKIGSYQELNLPRTVDETARNGGEIELVFEPRRRNKLRLLLVMDVGGSMMPYATLVSRLFSAAKKSYHFREFKHYYFHNTIYEYVYENMAQEEKYPTARLFHEYESNWRLILVGDASMHPYEIRYKTGGLYKGEGEGYTSVHWLQRLREHFPKSVWLNPVRLSQFHAETIDIIARIFPMYELTLDGIEAAIKDELL